MKIRRLFALDHATAKLIGCTAAVVFVLSIAASLGAGVAVREGPSDTPALAMLAAKGLVGGKLTDDRGTAVIPLPTAGTEVLVYEAGAVNGSPDATISEWQRTTWRQHAFGNDRLVLSYYQQAIPRRLENQVSAYGQRNSETGGNSKGFLIEPSRKHVLSRLKSRR